MTANGAARARPRLTLEVLEDRRVPATFGNPWPDALHLTASFAPDGTPVGSHVSSSAALGPDQAAWQLAVLRALQTWAVQGNVNVGVVPDGGQPLGAAGPAQGDPRFGDIRVAAVPLADDALAVAMPFGLSASTWSGDLLFNSGAAFGAAPGAADLFSVALHEAGHAFGLGPSTNPASVMYQNFAGVRTGLGPGDGAAFRALYGPRQHDAFDKKSSNNSFNGASKLDVDDDEAEAPAAGDVTTPADLDFYTFEVSGGFTVRVRTSGLSLLVPRLSVYNGSRQLIATVAATDPLHGDLELHVAGGPSRGKYYVKVEGATADVFGVGAYTLQVAPDGAPPWVPPLYLNDDYHYDDTPGKATDLRNYLFRSDARFAYAYQASLSSADDIDYYRLRAPRTGGSVMTVTVWALGPGGPDVAVTVIDRSTNRALPTAVLVREDGSLVVQATGIRVDKDYYVGVRAARPNGPRAVGNYSLGVDFGTHPVAFQPMAGGTLTAAAPQDFATLRVERSQLFHFVLSAQSAGAAPALRMTVYDANGQVVSTLVVQAGDARSQAVLLPAGTYAVRFAAAAPNGAPPPALTFQLVGLNLSDPIGPQLVDPTLTPVGPTPDKPPGSPDDYYWVYYDPALFALYYPFLSLIDPYSDPWW